MSNNKKYGEETKMVSFRVPESKESEIKQLVKLKLNEYEKSALIRESVVVDNAVPKWKQEIEKKSNPTDERISEVPKMSNFEKAIESVSEKPKVDMDALRKIASGEGLKGEFSLTKKKVVIDELYDFEIGSLPDIDDRVYVDKKSIAMVDKYNPGVYYVIWEGRNLMFTKKSLFDRFAKDNLIML